MIARDRVRRAIPRVVIVSSGGVRNAGDDAILLRTVERVRACDAFAEIEFVTDGIGPMPAVPDAQWLGGVGPHGEIDDLLDVRGCALVVLAGGGFACDWFGTPLLDRRTQVARQCRAAGVPVIVTGLGVGPLDDPHTIESVRALLGAASSASLRDPRSRAVLTECGVPVDRFAVTGDDAMGLCTPTDQIDRAVGDVPFVAVHVRRASYGCDDPAQLASWIRGAADVARADGCDVVGVSVNDQEHAPEADTLRRLADDAGAPGLRVIETAADPRLLPGVISRAQSVVTHSYHVALFALAAGRPTVFASSGAYYELKAAGLAELAGLSPAMASPVPLTGDELRARFDQVSRELATSRALARASDAVESWFADQWKVLVES